MPAQTQAARTRSRGDTKPSRPAYAALDLGTNNCRLLIAEPTGAGFRVVDGHSQIVRLGEGLVSSGRLADAAMERALAALQVCAEKLRQRPIAELRCIATQACRAAANGAEFLARVEQETGLSFSLIDPEEEARLAVLGCAPLIEASADLALIIDIGGGSTELSWVEARGLRAGAEPKILAWTSVPIGVVTLAERRREGVDSPEWYRALVEEVEEAVLEFRGAEPWREAFETGSAHYLGASGTVTSLAGVVMCLHKYQRAKVDGAWLTVDQARATAEQLRALGYAYRAQHPCIGPDRADLVVPGGAILEAIFRAWPAQRIRVADRGLREGVLYTLLKEAKARGAAA